MDSIKGETNDCLPLYRYVPDTDPQYHILFESRHDHEKDQEG
jgi:hypothetical protein